MPFGGGEDSGQRRTIDAGQRAQHHLGRGHRGAGIAGGDEAGGFAVANQAQAHAHRESRLGADRLRGLFVHAAVRNRTR